MCLVTTIFAYAKVFVTLRHNQIHVHNHVAQGQPSQAIPLNIARYRKAVYSAQWVQGTLGICYLPYYIAVFLTPQRGMPFSFYEFLSIKRKRLLIMASSLTRVRSLVRTIRIMMIECVLPGAIMGYPSSLPKLPYVGSLSNDDGNDNCK